MLCFPKVTIATIVMHLNLFVVLVIVKFVSVFLHLIILAIVLLVGHAPLHVELQPLQGWKFPFGHRSCLVDIVELAVIRAEETSLGEKFLLLLQIVYF